MTETDRLCDALAEALTQACREAMIKEGLVPSEKLLDKIHGEIKHAIMLR